MPFRIGDALYRGLGGGQSKTRMGTDVALRQSRAMARNLPRLDQLHARSGSALPLRSTHRCELAASAQFLRSLVRNFERTASKRFRFDALVDATAAPKRDMASQVGIVDPAACYVLGSAPSVMDRIALFATIGFAIIDDFAGRGLLPKISCCTERPSAESAHSWRIKFDFHEVCVEPIRHRR